MLEPGERVLDVACGTGLVTFPAADLVGPSGSIVGTDISEGMVEALTANARRRGLEHVTALRMDAEDLRVPDAGFDVVLCALGLMYVPDPLAALREMRRAVRPGGRVIAAVWGARASCGWAEVFPIVDARVESDVCPMFFRLGAGDALARTFADAGLAEVTATRVATTLEYATDEDACGAVFAGGPVALAYSRFDEATRAAAHAEYLASIAACRTPSGYAIPGEFVAARGIRR